MNQHPINTNDRKWDNRFLDLAAHVAGWSKDPSTKVGAILVINKRIVATGFNGFPAGHDDPPAKYADRAYKYEHVIHAEQNALDHCSAPLHRLYSTLYVTFPPCPDCARAIAKAGVRRVVVRPVPPRPEDPAWETFWANCEEISRGILEFHGVDYRHE